MYIDIFILIVFIWAIYTGWRNGFLKEVVSAVGFLVGLLIAAVFYSTLGEYLTVSGSESNMMTSIVAFFILWVMVPIVLGFAATVLTRALKGMRLGFPNSILGALVSLAKFFVLLACVMTVMKGISILDESKLENSRLARPILNVADFALDRGLDEVKDRTSPIAPSDSLPAAVPGDTTWIDVSKK